MCLADPTSSTIPSRRGPLQSGHATAAAREKLISRSIIRAWYLLDPRATPNCAPCCGGGLSIHDYGEAPFP
jgi:hypothetical protein